MVCVTGRLDGWRSSEGGTRMKEMVQTSQCSPCPHMKCEPLSSSPLFICTLAFVLLRKLLALSWMFSLVLVAFRLGVHSSCGHGGKCHLLATVWCAAAT